MEYWRASRLNTRTVNNITHAKKLIAGNLNTSTPISLGILSCSQPFRVLISHQQSRQRSKLFITHMWKEPLFKGSVSDVGKLGGYCFAKPLLNQRIDKINKEGSTLTDHFVADLLWPDSRIILEYDSDDYHVNTKSHASDSIRRAELTDLGYTVISVTRPQVTTALGTKNLAGLLAKQMERRLQLPEPDFSEACAELRKALFKTSLP